MADMLKITTPIANKNLIHHTAESRNIDGVGFNMQDTARVVRSSPDSELLQQNNGFVEDGAPKLLLDMLKDPAVTVTFLKNIFSLQEMLTLMPLKNNPVTEELEHLFDGLMLTPDQIASEMKNQENNATAFKGELFDFLRNITSENQSPEMKNAVANLLKSISCESSRDEILSSIYNGLKFLAEGFEGSATLTDRMNALAEKFRNPEEAGKNFNVLKKEVAELMDDSEQSVLFSEKLSKMVNIVRYNLTRYNTNENFTNDAARSLLRLLSNRQDKAYFVELLRNFTGKDSAEFANMESSKVMDALVEIISKQANEAGSQVINSDKIDKIIESLLSSPCNFTPLLHFVIPVEDMDIKAFAEIWINAEEEEEKKSSGGSVRNNTHMLIVFDIEGIGQFEMELFVRDKDISMSLLCPEEYYDDFKDTSKGFNECISFSEYRIKDIRVDKREHQRSLIEVFKTLPYKRTGVNVKI